MRKPHDSLLSNLKSRGATPIIPAGSVTGKSLTVVVSIMCFLACLTAGAVYLVNQSAVAWLENISSEVTVQIKPIENADNEKRVEQVAQFLSRQSGVNLVRPLSLDESAALLEPWLGKTDILTALPVPRLIALEIDRKTPPDLLALTANLENSFKGVMLDDHRHWQLQIRTVTRSLALGGILLLILMAAATTAVIVSATKSALASNREIVEVLHFVGATDSFIAREFEKHFLTLGIRAGFLGAISAISIFILMPVIMRLVSGNAVTAAEIRRLVGTASLDLPGYVLLVVVVIIIAALCMLTSRYGVFRILHTKH
jgi:cell division transport system permease protein